MFLDCLFFCPLVKLTHAFWLYLVGEGLTRASKNLQMWQGRFCQKRLRTSFPPSTRARWGTRTRNGQWGCLCFEGWGCFEGKPTGNRDSGSLSFQLLRMEPLVSPSPFRSLLPKAEEIPAPIAALKHQLQRCFPKSLVPCGTFSFQTS